MSESVIPVIDYDSLNEQSARLAVDDACREWGFFQLVNPAEKNPIPGKRHPRPNERFARSNYRNQ